MWYRLHAYPDSGLEFVQSGRMYLKDRTLETPTKQNQRQINHKKFGSHLTPPWYNPTARLQVEARRPTKACVCRAALTVTFLPCSLANWTVRLSLYRAATSNCVQWMKRCWGFSWAFSVDRFKKFCLFTNSKEENLFITNQRCIIPWWRVLNR